MMAVAMAGKSNRDEHNQGEVHRDRKKAKG